MKQYEKRNQSDSRHCDGAGFAAVFATEAEQVYISASHDGQFIADGSGNLLAYTAVFLEEAGSIDLAEYGLSDYAYDADGDGACEITALHPYIFCSQDWSNFTVTGSTAGIYFAGGLFGFEDENLRCNYNGAWHPLRWQLLFSADWNPFRCDSPWTIARSNHRDCWIICI